MKKNIPNLITILNLFSGCISITLAFSGYKFLPLAGLLIFIAAVFDFLDGLCARLLKSYSDLGKQLDSLSDLISFGLAPAVIVFQLLNASIGKEDIFNPNSSLDAFMHGTSTLNYYITYSIPELLITFSAFIITVFSALRLAKFNIDSRQTSSFIGLPTPANAILIASLPIILSFGDCTSINNLLLNTYVLLSLIIIQSYLLISPIPIYSLKMKSLKWKDNKTRYIFLFVSVILLATIRFYALPLIIFIYIISSIINNIFCSNK